MIFCDIIYKLWGYNFNYLYRIQRYLHKTKGGVGSVIAQTEYSGVSTTLD
jgi:hypothetical protein